MYSKETDNKNGLKRHEFIATLLSSTFRPEETLKFCQWNPILASYVMIKVAFVSLGVHTSLKSCAVLV